jgi:hypothetical protein
MKVTFLRIAGVASALAAFGMVCIVGIHAQAPSSAASMTTNWIGNLVVGKEDTTDRIARGPFPTTVRQVEIGLRSDGVVVWRSR